MLRYLRLPFAWCCLLLPAMLSAQADSSEILVFQPPPFPPDTIISRAIQARPSNNYENLPGWQFDITTSEMVYIDKAASLQKESLLKPFSKILQRLSKAKQDTSERFIPVFNFKNHSSYYYRKDPRLKKEEVHSYYVEDHGIFNKEFLGQVTGKTFMDFNFYNDYLDMFDRLFLSPLSEKALKHYNYAFIETVREKGRSYYVIYFTPKRKWRRDLYGQLNIDSATYALNHVSVGFGEAAAINFVENFTMDQYYKPMEYGDSVIFFPERMNIFLKMVRPYLKTIATQAEICSQHNNILLGEPKPKSFYRRRIELGDSSAQQMVPEFQASVGACELSTLLQPEKKSDTYGSRFLVGLAEIAVTRYISMGPIALGPLLEGYSQNLVEGNRFQLGFRTKDKLKSSFRLKGYLAYGTKDERFKHNLQLQYFLNKKDWTVIGIQRDYDLFGLGSGQRFFSNNNFRPVSDRFANLEKFFLTTDHTAWFESDYFRGFTGYLIARHRNMRPEGDFVFSYLDNIPADSTKKKNLNTSELTIQARISPDEFFLHSGNTRYYIRTGSIPTLTIAYTHGFENVLNSDFSYDKIVAQVAQRARFYSIGRLEYSVIGKKVFTPLPYPLLNFARGNQSFIINDNAFNLVRLNEFASDQSVSAFISFHFDGNLSNRIPLFRKLGWRTVTTFSIGYGELNNRNRELLPETDAEGRALTPLETYSGNIPYAEAGFGFENIFRFFKIHAYQRLTYLDNPDAQRFGVKAGFYLDF
ncbi:MAG: DUF5686 family protein [Bacteroidia bacterium]